MEITSIMIYQLNSSTELIYYSFFGTVFGWRIILELNILILEYFLYIKC